MLTKELRLVGPLFYALPSTAAAKHWTFSCKVVRM